MRSKPAIAGALAGSVLACSPAFAQESAPRADFAGWWQDAVFYEVFVRSFADSTEGPLAGDGVGDLRGLIENLDYLNDGDPDTTDDLGVTALWLMPIMQSPSYHGYDIVDYLKVDDEYGTNEDFMELTREAEKRGIRVTVDLVLNHTSWEHPWFQDSANRHNGKDDWYIWSPTDDDELTTWGHPTFHDHMLETRGEYFYGFFWHGMPELDFTNPEVTEATFDLSRYWLETLGAAGFRLDAIKHLIEANGVYENAPETHAWFRGYQNFLTSVRDDAYTVGEVWSPTEETLKYVPDGVNQVFEFDMAYAMVGAVNAADAKNLREVQQRVWTEYPDGSFATFLTNHDQNRVMSELVGSPRRADLRKRSEAGIAASLLLLSPGTPYLYYGEEIGMTGTKPDPDIRTPMQWEPNRRTAGFTSGEPWRAPNANVRAGVSVEAQEDRRDSLLDHYKTLIHLRRAEPALARGVGRVVPTGSDSVSAFIRQEGEEAFLIIANLSARTQPGVWVSPGRFPGLGPEVIRPRELLEGEDVEPTMVDENGEIGANGMWTPIQRLAPHTAYAIKISG
ncbi:MAG: alpha-amylase family glycosyl hydrolase [Planctomycetota bacterium]